MSRLQKTSVFYTNVAGQVRASKQITGANEKQLACANSQNFLKFKITNMGPGVIGLNNFSEQMFSPSPQHVEPVRFNSWASIPFETAFS